ncbi:MAG: choice-of-anchor D domain-containing protein, partial [Phycisphaerales bacterium]
ATDVTSASARLNGQVTGTAGENPAVYIYWGDEDGGTVAENWDNELSLGTMAEGPFYADLSGLINGRTYYYRCYVADSTTGLWASSTDTFQAVTATVVFEEGDYWRYFKGYSTPATGWNAIGFNDADWLLGRTGIGYGDGDDNTNLTDMEDHYVTVYMRYTFWVDYPEQVTNLAFTVDYDDGFVAFINGGEVAREGVPQGQNHQTEAANHEAGTPQVIDLTQHISRLAVGDNVFAIEVHNQDISSSDLSMIPELIMTGGLREPQPDIRLDPEAMDFSQVNVGLSSDLTFNIENTGALPLQVASLEVVGLDKASYAIISPAVPLTLPASGGTQAVTVRFAPKAARPYNYASVAVASDDPDRPVASVSLQGQGLATTQKSLDISGGIGGESLAIAKKDPYVLLGQGATLTILDVSDPCNPAAVGRARLADVIQAIAVSGNTAYAACGSSGLLPVDITDVSTPAALGAVDTPGYAYDAAARGTTLCVADGPRGLAFYDISTPAAPALRGAYQTQGPATAVALSGTTAYVLDARLGLQIVDVAGSTAVLLGSLNQIEFGRSITLSGTLACITDSLGNLFVVDAANPAAPVLRGRLRLLATGASAEVTRVDTNDLAYVATGDQGIEVVLLSDPASPVHVGAYDTAGQACDLAVSGSQIYVADGSSGMEVLRIDGSGAAIRPVGAYRLQSSPYAAASDGPLAFVAAGRLGLVTVDLSVPASPGLVSVLDNMLEADIYKDNAVDLFDFSLLGRYWGTDGALGGDIYRDNVVDALDLAKLAADWLSTDSLDEVQDIVVAGTLAYLANGRSGFQIADMSDPSAPRAVGDYQTYGSACSVAVEGSVAAVADGTSVYILNVSNPSAPSLVGRWESAGWAKGVAIAGEFAYVADGGKGLQILNLADASHVASFDTPGVAYSVVVANNVAFVADGRTGVLILDVTAPAVPSPIGNFDTGTVAVDVAVAGSLLYVAGGTNVTVVDISSPALPVLYARSNAPVRSLSTAVSGSRIIVSDTKGGLLILALQ